MIRTTVLPPVIFLLVVAAGVFIFPWSTMHWGSISQEQMRTITVSGTASSIESNEIANFYAGAEAVNDDKDAATGEVNKKMEDLLVSLKTFGIPSEDIETSNMGVYQNQDSYRPGQWRVNNSVTIKLRDIKRADELSDLLVGSGLTNVSGPNFMMDEESTVDNELISLAVDDARKKAEVIAKNQGLSLGKVISISEGSVPQYYSMAKAGNVEGGGGGPSAPGSSTITASALVIFELR